MLNDKDNPIVEVIEVASEEDANYFLQQDWVLLQTGFTHVQLNDETEEKIGTFLYCLGRPISVRNTARDKEIIEHNLKRIMNK